MCGRCRVSLDRQQVAVAAQVPEEQWTNAESFVPSYNFSPGHDAPVVFRNAAGRREVRTMRWGLMPHTMSGGATPDHFRMFNARSETVADKFVFSSLLRRRRCVFLCNGWYEWLKQGSKKQPYYVHVGKDRVLMMAALYDEWQRGCDDDTPLQTFTILTADASTRLSWLHNRMPVILSTEEAAEAWLSGQPLDSREFNQHIAVSYDGGDLQWHQVTPELGKVTTQGPQCTRPLNQGRDIATMFGKSGAAKATRADSVKSPAAPEVKPEPSDCSSFLQRLHHPPLWNQDNGVDGIAKSEPGHPLCGADPASGPPIPLNPDDNISEAAADVKQNPAAEEHGTEVGVRKRVTGCGPPKRGAMLSPSKAGIKKSPGKGAIPDKSATQKTMHNFFAKKP